MKIWENKDFRINIDSARRRTKKCGAKDDIDTIYLLEKEIDCYRDKINNYEKYIKEKHLRTAKEMFEELGFKIYMTSELFECIEMYVKTNKHIDIVIKFYKSSKYYEIYIINHFLGIMQKQVELFKINMKTHEAIHRRCEELGWLYD